MSLKKKMSAAALRAIFAHYGHFEDVSAVIVSLVVCHMLHVLSIEVDCLFSGQSVTWDQRGLLLVHYLSFRK